MSEETKLIRRIARELRYRSLDELINRELTINQLDSVEKDISAALSDVLPQGCKYVETERQFLEGAMVKYGIIDVTFAAPERLLNSRDEGGISLLKDLGFIDEVDKEDHADSSELFGSDLLASNYRRRAGEEEHSDQIVLVGRKAVNGLAGVVAEDTRR